jgi:hypothetical protein
MDDVVSVSSVGILLLFVAQATVESSYTGRISTNWAVGSFDWRAGHECLLNLPFRNLRGSL